jgi:hypothetical protein
MRSICALLLAWTLAPTHVVAQWGAGAPPEEPQAPPPTAVAPSPPAAPYAPQPPPRAIGFISSFNIGVPFLLDTDREVVRPGANLNGRFLFTTRYVGLGVQGGFQWVPIDLDASSGTVQRFGREPMRRGYFGPLLHLQFPTNVGFTPYAQGGFDLNFWNFRESAFVCDFWYCYSTNVYRFATGVHGRLGARLALGPMTPLYVDLGVELGTSFEGDFFFENQPWVMPFIGLGLQR